MAKNKTALINRNEYNRIRKMDHSQLSAWVAEMYRNGFNDGKKAASGLNRDELGELLLQIKGIGEKKVEVIVNAVDEAMRKKGQRLEA